MRRIPSLIIAKNVFEDARHNKVLFIAFGFAVALILFSYFLGQVSLNQDLKVMKDLGLAGSLCSNLFEREYLV